MWLDDDLSIRKQDLFLSHPFVNAAGTLGFAPDPHAMDFLDQLGAFITHPIRRRSRVPAGKRCCLPDPGGFLLHTGLPNPGISRAISRYRPAWAGASLPVIVNLLVETPETLVEMIRKIGGWRISWRLNWVCRRIARRISWQTSWLPRLGNCPPSPA